MGRKQGAWVIEAQGDVIIESSEIKALRLAATQSGVATFVEYGQTLAQAKAQPAVDESAPGATLGVTGQETLAAANAAESSGEDQPGEF